MPPDLLDLIGQDTVLKRVCARHGGEYAGACSLCRRGTDRLVVWPAIGRWACLGPEAGRAGCGIGGDAPAYLQQRDGLRYADACALLGIEPHAPRRRAPGEAAAAAGPSLFAGAEPPNPQWQGHGRAFVARGQLHLWRSEGRKARAYLHGRGLDDDTIRACGLGYQPQNEREDPARWGLEAAGERKPVWLPRGIVIPWFAGAATGAETGGALWRINIRRPITAGQAARGEPKYMGPRGCGNALYQPCAAAEAQAKPVLLVEGEIDAMTARQTVADLVTPMATGSTAGGRRAPWLAQLSAAPFVLVAFDFDRNGAGDQAANWWIAALPNALRWRPLLHDVNAMHVCGADLRQWVAGGIEYARQLLSQINRTRP
jgi:DNA primase